MKKWVAKILVVLLMAYPATADDPFLDMLNNRGNNREAILREFKDIQPITVNSPAEFIESPAPSDATPADYTTPTTAPRFRPLTPQPGNSSIITAPSALALVLPTDAGGLTGATAMRFYEGCTSGLNSELGAVQLNLYATDGSAASVLSAYRQAIKDGATFIIGPMRKKNIIALQRRYPNAPVPTLLLQPGGGEKYYVMTLNIEQEIAELAQVLYAKNYQVLLVSDNSPQSKRQASAFSGAWGKLSQAPLSRFYVYDKTNDWKRLFEQLKDQSVEKTEQNTNQSTAKEKPRQTVLFAAGNRKFVRNIRNFSPQGYPVFASSIFYTGEQGAAAMFLENLQMMEMPWFLTDESELLNLETPLVRSRPVLQQRFYALGADACRVAKKTPFWFDGWQFDGISGNLELRDKTFVRRGLLARYQSGLLLPLSR